MVDEEPAHSQCVSLRLDPSTLNAIERKLKGVTLSSSIGHSITSTLRELAIKAESAND